MNQACVDCGRRDGKHSTECITCDTETAPSLVTYLEVLSMTGRKQERVVLKNGELREIIAALRAVEAVRTFPKYDCAVYYCQLNIGGVHSLACTIYRDGVRAVQALLDGE